MFNKVKKINQEWMALLTLLSMFRNLWEGPPGSIYEEEKVFSLPAVSAVMPVQSEALISADYLGMASPGPVVGEVCQGLKEVASHTMKESGAVLARALNQMGPGDTGSLSGMVAVCAIGAVIMLIMSEQKNDENVYKVEATYGNGKPCKNLTIN